MDTGCRTFGYYFNENMSALGLPTIKNIGDSFANIGTNVTAMLGALSHFGSKATVAELLGATLKAEKAGVFMALYGSFYMGACVGSLAVVSMRFQDCHPRALPLGSTGRNNPYKYGQHTNRLKMERLNRAQQAQQVILWGQINNVYADQIRHVLIQHPEIYDTDAANRRFFLEAAKIR